MRTLLTILFLQILSCELYSQESFIGNWMITKMNYFEYDTTGQSDNVLESDSLGLPDEKPFASWSGTRIPLIIKNNGELILLGKKDYKGKWEMIDTSAILINLRKDKFYAEIKHNNIWLRDLNTDSSRYIIGIRLPNSILSHEPDLCNKKLQFDALHLGTYDISFSKKPRLRFKYEYNSGKGKWNYKFIDNSYYLFLTLDYYSAFVLYIYEFDKEGYHSILFNSSVNNIKEYYEQKLLIEE